MKKAVLRLTRYSLFIFRLLRLLIYSNEPMNSNDNLMTIKKRFVHGRVIIISFMCVHLYIIVLRSNGFINV